MAEPLKDSFRLDVADAIAEMVHDVYPPFDSDTFLADCAAGFEERSLTERARHLADALADHLPAERSHAVTIITDALPPEIDGADLTGMASFRYLPFVFFVAEHGLDHFEEAMLAQYELTKRFTAEFSIRAYLDRYPTETLARLAEWAHDPNVHVRRLVSEGTRPRLPWAPRLRRFIDDPAPVIALLELLKDDPEEYVRRSVANNLNDISKDHPDVAVAVARRWATPQRRRLVRHGLRTLVKRGHLDALAVLGFGPDSPARVRTVAVDPTVVAIGGSIRITVDVDNPTDEPAAALIDLIVHFVKANGLTSPKVFKGAETTLAPHDTRRVTKTISLKQHSTRRHYPGCHVVEAQVNGAIVAGAEFTLTP